RSAYRETLGNRRVLMSEEISGGRLGWQPVGPVYPVKKRQIRDFLLGAYWTLQPSVVTAGASWTGTALSMLANAGPRRSGGGAGAASGRPLLIPDRPPRAACAIFRHTRSSAA